MPTCALAPSLGTADTPAWNGGHADYPAAVTAQLVGPAVVVGVCALDLGR